MGAFADLHNAVIGSLRGHAGLTALVDARVFDDVPHGSEATAPAFPYVVVGDQAGADDSSADDTDISRVTITLHVWSRAAGALECLQVLDAVRDALRWDRAHATPTGRVIDMSYIAHETNREADGETYHGLLRVSALYQFG